MQQKISCKSNGLPIIEKTQYDLLAEEILNEFMPEALKQPMAIDIEYLITECMYLEIREVKMYIKYIFALTTFSEIRIPDKDCNIIEAHEGTILINVTLKSVGTRWRFTLAHELAHWLLHRRFFALSCNKIVARDSGVSYVEDVTDVTEFGRKNPKLAKTDEDMAEFQADKLAAALLMPKKTFIEAVHQSMKTHGVSGLRLIAGENFEAQKQIFDELSNIFQVSNRSVEIRMRNYGLYTNAD